MTRPGTGKAAEREVAARLGGRRVPVTGRARGEGGPDVEHKLLSIEVKHRGSLPKWLLGAMAQAEAASRRGKVPAAVLHLRGQPYDDCLAVLRLKDLAALTGGVLVRLGLPAVPEGPWPGDPAPASLDDVPLWLRRDVAAVAAAGRGEAERLRGMTELRRVRLEHEEAVLGWAFALLDGEKGDGR